jgi:hypothetical protein
MNWYKRAQNQQITNIDRINALIAIHEKAQVAPREAKMDLLQLAKTHFRGGPHIRKLKVLILESARKARDNYKEMRRIIKETIRSLKLMQDLEDMKEEHGKT